MLPDRDWPTVGKVVGVFFPERRDDREQQRLIASGPGM